MIRTEHDSNDLKRKLHIMSVRFKLVFSDYSVLDYYHVLLNAIFSEIKILQSWNLFMEHTETQTCTHRIKLFQ